MHAGGEGVPGRRGQGVAAGSEQLRGDVQGGLQLDDVSLIGGEPWDWYVPKTDPPVRVNQVGYLPDGPKHATVVTDAPDPLAWQVGWSLHVESAAAGR